MRLPPDQPWWRIYYRGSLSSCNYGCDYCPFAKTSNTRAQLAKDRSQLERFVAWVAHQSAPNRFGILITPWGEALGHRYYRKAMIELSKLPQVHRIAIQTNLSAPVSDFQQANLGALALWTTYHPTQTSMKRFLARCRQLDQISVRYSVGVVGLKEHFEDIEALRNQLSPNVYLWINAYKRQVDYYSPQDIQRLQAVDRHFHWNLQRYPSRNKPCNAGYTSFAVDGDGVMRRCHFVAEPIGNLYSGDFPRVLQPVDCPAEACGCHIGYIHRPELNLESLYGEGLMERIPQSFSNFSGR
jgi:organic radical activating enzyme